LRDIIDRMRHDGCGGKARKVELLTGIEGASSRTCVGNSLPNRVMNATGFCFV